MQAYSTALRSIGPDLECSDLPCQVHAVGRIIDGQGRRSGQDLEANGEAESSQRPLLDDEKKIFQPRHQCCWESMILSCESCLFLHMDFFMKTVRLSSEVFLPRYTFLHQTPASNQRHSVAEFYSRCRGLPSSAKLVAYHYLTTAGPDTGSVAPKEAIQIAHYSVGAPVIGFVGMEKVASRSWFVDALPTIIRTKPRGINGT